MKILEHITEKRNGHYCHALELTDVYDLGDVIEGLMMDLGEQFTLNEYLDFFGNISIYFIEDEDGTEEHNKAMETELYSADISELVRCCYDGF